MQYLNVQDERIESVCLRADRLIGNVTSRNLFTGYGLFYKKEFMFALWLNGKFYLQAKNELAQQLMRSGCSPFTTNEVNRRFVLADYYRLSSNIMGDESLLRKLFMLSIKQIQERRNALALSKANRLKELPNLSIKYERMLKKVDIPDVATLKSVGAENAIVRLKKAGIPATLQTYWRIVAALHNKNCVLFTKSQKEILLKKLNEVLHKAGFRKYRRVDDE